MEIEACEPENSTSEPNGDETEKDGSNNGGTTRELTETELFFMNNPARPPIAIIIEDHDDEIIGKWTLLNTSQNSTLTTLFIITSFF